MGSTVSPAGILTDTHTCRVNANDRWTPFVFCFVLFTCKRSDSGISDWSSRMDVSSSRFVLVTTALLAPPLPVLFAMTCSDRWRSCDSSGMSRRMKTTSNLDSRAEPILKTWMHKYEATACVLTQISSAAVRQIIKLLLTSGFPTLFCLCCNGPLLGLPQQWQTFWQAARRRFQP